MLKILLACSAGMSTSLLEESIKKYAKSINEDVEVIAVPSNEAKTLINNYDICLLGPQVRFMEESFKQLSEGTPVVVIPPHIYALAKGKLCMKLIKETLS